MLIDDTFDIQIQLFYSMNMVLSLDSLESNDRDQPISKRMSRL